MNCSRSRLPVAGGSGAAAGHLDNCFASSRRLVGPFSRHLLGARRLEMLLHRLERRWGGFADVS